MPIPHAPALRALLVCRLLARRLLAYGLDVVLLFAVLAPLGFVVGGALGVAVPATPRAVYLVVAWRTDGRRSVHDLAAGTAVEPAAPTPTLSAPPA